MPNRGAWNSSVSVNGSVTIPAGYHNGSGRVTNSVSTMGGQTITPRSTSQTVSCSGRYMTGNIVVNGDSNLVAANIISGKSIFGVAGNARKYAGSSHWGIATVSSGTFIYAGDNGSIRYPYFDVSGFGYTPTRISAHGNDDYETMTVYDDWNYRCDGITLKPNSGSAVLTYHHVCVPVRVRATSGGTGCVYMAGYY